MRYRYFLLFLCFLLFTKNLKATNYDDKTDFNLLQKNLINIQQELKDIKDTKEKILKLYISFFVFNNIREKVTKIDKNKEDFWEMFTNYEDRYLFKKFLINSLVKSLIKKEEKLKEKELFYLSEINKLRKKELNNTKLNAEHSNFVKSPIDGNIKQINFTENKLTLTIEGDRCKAYIVGIEILKVNLGDYVKKGDILGENLSQKEKPKATVKCN